MAPVSLADYPLLDSVLAKGSVLGPFLYMHSLPACSHPALNFRCLLYADDVTISSPDLNIQLPPLHTALLGCLMGTSTLRTRPLMPPQTCSLPSLPDPGYWHHMHLADQTKHWGVILNSSLHTACTSHSSAYGSTFKIFHKSIHVSSPPTAFTLVQVTTIPCLGYHSGEHLLSLPSPLPARARPLRSSLLATSCLCMVTLSKNWLLGCPP